MIQVRVARERIRYPVRIDAGLLDRAGGLLLGARAPETLLVVTDRTVARLHGGRFLASLQRAGFKPRVLALPPGERSKTLAWVRSLCDRWAGWRVDRSVPVLALGGGVVSDVAGFAAATYARGLDWFVFPTTLLAQADAGIGGKVGVNLAGGKNLLGAFHHPRGVFCDPDVLRTLKPRAFRSGLAEIVKMGVIRRPSILRGVRLLAGSAGHPEGARVQSLIRAAATEKAWYVSRDPNDRGARQALNFGHTVGHALEASYGYGRLTHGEAVSIGMVAALRMSVRHAGLDPGDARDTEELLRSLGLPVRLERPPNAAFWRALEKDKKRGRVPLRMVLSPAIGAAKTYELPSLTSLRGVLLSLVQKP
ncbi:MAG TPA: 3-dehydroquinate synthase family protein [Candidatus Eisenbacteria bacterium]